MWWGVLGPHGHITTEKWPSTDPDIQVNISSLPEKDY